MLKATTFTVTHSGIYKCRECGKTLHRDELATFVVTREGLMDYYCAKHPALAFRIKAENALERLVLGNVYYFNTLGETPITPDIILIWWNIALELFHTKEYDLMVWGGLVSTAANMLNAGVSDDDFDPTEALTWAQMIVAHVPKRFRGDGT